MIQDNHSEDSLALIALIVLIKAKLLSILTIRGYLSLFLSQALYYLNIIRREQLVRLY